MMIHEESQSTNYKSGIGNIEEYTSKTWIESNIKLHVGRYGWQALLWHFIFTINWLQN